MSRGDLDRIQAQLKVAIQNHQMLVTRMRGNPQNASFQDQLHELQSQITSLSEKQKMIVQHLRKELVVKPNQDSRSPSSSPGLQIASGKNSPTLTTRPQNSALLPTTPVSSTMDSQLKVQSSPSHHVIPAPTQSHMLNNNTKTVKTENILIVNQKPNTTALRVPQIHAGRPSILQGAPRQVPGKVNNSPLVPVSARRGSDTDFSNYRKLSISKDASPEERKKLEYMASLDLITHTSLKELQNRRSERKRRSTANPQFSYGHYEPERKREVVTYLSQVPIQPGVRRRVIYQASPAVLYSSINNKHSKLMVDIDGHEDLCAVCVRSGELLLCDTCSLVYHLDCLDPPLVDIPQGAWSCPKCQAINQQHGTDWPGTLALVHSYITHKAAKEEEKGKLAKQLQELRAKHQKLEQEAAVLSDKITLQVTKKADLLSSYHTAQQSVDKLKNLIRVFQTS